MRLLRKRFYKFLRNVFPSAQYADQEKVRRRLSFIYMISAWHLFGAALYYIYRKNTRDDTSGLSPAERYVMSGSRGQTARIISVSSLGGVQDRHISEEEMVELKKKKQESVVSLKA